MPRKELPKGQNMDALDSIVNVLREQNEIIEKLTDEVGKIISRLQESGGLEGFEKVEEKIGRVQNDVSNLSRFLSAPSSEVNDLPTPDPVAVPANAPRIEFAGCQLVVVRCERWSDFLDMASGASTVSFSYRESDKTFEADALKGNRVFAYVGAVPAANVLLKTYLCKQLQVSEEEVFEGALTKA
jgi:hypothetical protein